MTPSRPNVAGVNAVRRIEIGGILVLAAAGMLLGAVAPLVGFQLPAAAMRALANAQDVLGWLRMALVAVLIFRVARAREEPF